jgi:hypothetical protein
VSVFKPEDRDYATRGIELMLAWLFVGIPGMAFAVALVFDNGGAGFLGVLAAIVLGIGGFWAYLRFGERQHAKEASRRLELMIEERKIQLELVRRARRKL